MAISVNLMTNDLAAGLSELPIYPACRKIKEPLLSDSSVSAFDSIENGWRGLSFKKLLSMVGAQGLEPWTR